jgi:UDP-N-acetylmuramoylalanine--D-glutamate ligase
MITVAEYKNQKIGVFGLGKAGMASVDALLAGGAEVYAWDDKVVEGNGYQVAGNRQERDNPLPDTCHLSPIAHWPWAELKALVLSPGVPLTHPKPHEVVTLAKRHNVPVIGDVELLYRACPDARYVAITGTNGKSTTTTLIGHILAQAGLTIQVGGNLGTPALALEPLGENGTYVLELSSYQLDLLRTARFNVAVLLNVTPDHLDRHGDMAGYIAAKMHIFDRQRAGDVAVVAVDDEHTKKVTGGGWRVTEKATLMRVSSHHALEKGIFVENGQLRDVCHLPPVTCDLSSIPTLTGRHNWQNAAAAYAAARACGVASEVIFAAIQSFPGLRHRLQLVSTIRGVRFINDSKATNADATANALAPYDAIYWIVGGKPKAGGIAALAEYFPKIAHAFLIGEAEEEFADTLRGRVAFTRCGTLQVAVEKAAAMAFTQNRPGAVLLLSPACASFDQWENFEQRGDAFCKMVDILTTTEGARHAS